MIKLISENKEDYIDILLIADPFADLVKKYLNEGNLYVLEISGEVVCAAVVTLEGNTAEIKNLSTALQHQKKGYGRQMMNFLINEYAAYNLILATGGTGIPGVEFYQVRFYRSCGFEVYRVVPNFFVDNYPEPIIEDDGNQCVDMVCMKHKKEPTNS